MSSPNVLIEAFREELLRWNRQINLVSRQETSDRLDGLFSQCIGGAIAVDEYIAQLGGGGNPGYLAHYFDLGSGGGLPGVIWHILFSENAKAGSVDCVDELSLKSHLVEPREKRAWFLSRLNRIAGLPSMDVLRGRWGEVAPVSCRLKRVCYNVPVVLISLKALHLDDVSVLAGLRKALPGDCRVVIARFYPPNQVFNQELGSLLGIHSAGTQAIVAGYKYTSLGGEVVPLAPPGKGKASLVVSSYNVDTVL